MCGQCARQDLQLEVLLVMQSVGAALDQADFVVQALDEPEGDLVVGMTVRGNSIPMPVDQLGELLVRLQALPLQLSAPVFEELTSPGLAGVIPQLCEGLLEQVGGVQTLVGRQQQLEVLYPGACACDRREFCAGARTPSGKQGALEASDDYAEHRTRPSQLSEMRLRLLKNLYKNERAQAALLQVHWL